VLAHIEPSWATRYLAVVVGPLILLLAMGLARAGAIGIAALAVAGLLILQPVTRINGLPMPRDAKSNGHGLAHQMAPRLAPGDLVLAAQPEAVPLLALELGDGFDYGDPTGIVEDPTFMDWRDAEDRLRAASFDTDLAPLVDALRPGDRVLLVLPGKEPRETDTSWIRLFRSRGRQIESALRADDRFGVVDVVVGSDREYVTLDAVLFERLSR
jgi:hypothetical protein